MDVVVGKSKINGKGVFANRDFLKGEIVINWATCSKSLTKEEVDSLSNAEKRYVSFLSSGKWVLFNSPGKFVNHSCNSNTNAINGCDIAVRDIKKGEEITADYVAEQVPSLSMTCNCGSKNCIGVIISK